MKKVVILFCLLVSNSVFAKNTTLDEKVTVEFKDMSVKRILSELSKSNQLDIVVGKKTQDQSNLSLRLKDVKIREVFDLIAKSKNTSWKETEEGKIFFE